jgi:hypothetical protein
VAPPPRNKENLVAIPEIDPRFKIEFAVTGHLHRSANIRCRKSESMVQGHKIKQGAVRGIAPLIRCRSHIFSGLPCNVRKN